MIADPFELISLDDSHFPKTCQVLREALAEGVIPGAVAGFWRKSAPQKMTLGAFGHRRLLPSTLPMTVDTIFDLASVSKVFATATLAAALVDRGWLSWDLSVSAVFPDYPYSKIQLRHLLSHTAGFVSWQPFWEKLRLHFVPDLLEKVSVSSRQKAMRSLILSVIPDVEVGVRALYSDVSFLLLGYVLEEVTQMPLDEAVKRFLWQPMGIREPYYNRVKKSVAADVHIQVAATENCPWRGGVVQGQVHDDNCWAMGGYGGHAGVFAKAQDVLQFSKALMGGFLSQRVRQAMWTRVSEPANCDRTLGWDTPSGEKSSVGKYFSHNTVGHLGFAGTSLWIDLEAELAVVLFTNRVHPTRDNIKIRELRPRFHDALRMELK